ncbi:MAG: twin-arginine translocation pathway signal [Synechococcaceae cyanobacterium]|jgi:putative spermidine/putrescine transport system substrate-binding protein|nr:twin-arginine translocation pathway signal [Synechococcaceae cyanobacterium]
MAVGQASDDGDGGGTLSRRSVLVLAALTGAGLLAGCERGAMALLASRGDIASAWAAQLPRPWSLKLLEDPQQVLAQRAEAQLLQLSDGWASSLDPAALAPIGSSALLARLDPAAHAPGRLFASEGPVRAWPWSVSPWVIVLRSRFDLLRHRAEGWNLLLDPSLAGKLVLPSSPRVSMALMGEDPGRLAQLRRAAIACDEPNALNLLLTARAEAAVLPRQRVVPLLRRDPRIAVLLPDDGAPLSWNLLLRGGKPWPEPPLDWLAAVLEPPLLLQVLRAGWVPPLPHGLLEQVATGLPQPLARLLVPPEQVWRRCFSLPPLEGPERQRLQRLWDASAPPPAAAAR